MKWIVALLLLCVGCGRSDTEVVSERPVVNIPQAFRQANYLSSGSCVHASLITLLKWQGQYDDAAKWRRDFGGGEWADGLAKKMESRGIRYAYVTNGDASFLEWACKTRRGCGITVKSGAHMVTLVHLDKEWAAILDNNDVSKFTWIPRDKLIAEWKSSFGWAVTPIYTPAAPLPQ